MRLKSNKMKIEAKTVEQYIGQLEADRQEVMHTLRQTILDNIPAGFEECINYNMIGYVVPKATYPDGYHCDPKLPVPFVDIASQKNFVAFYHMGLYAIPEVYDWFVNEYPKHSKTKLDMGKSCVRFKKMNDIPYALIGALMQKISVEDYLGVYESVLKK